MIAVIQVPKATTGSGYNPFQTGHSPHRDKQKTRAYQEREFQRILDRELKKGGE